MTNNQKIIAPSVGVLSTKARFAEEFMKWAGWTVFTSDDDYGQGKVKREFFAVSEETGDTREIDITPYEYGDTGLIKRIIEAGFPGRIGPSPLTHGDLDMIEANLPRCADAHPMAGFQGGN